MQSEAHELKMKARPSKLLSVCRGDMLQPFLQNESTTFRPPGSETEHNTEPSGHGTGRGKLWRGSVVVVVGFGDAGAIGFRGIRTTCARAAGDGAVSFVVRSPVGALQWAVFGREPPPATGWCARAACTCSPRAAAAANERAP
jgi:hypothetical protein